MASLSGTLATMGPGVPYAIAAKFAHPDRPVIALVGDGAMQMNGINELITIAKYRAALARPAADRARAQQPRPQPGHLGAAGDGGRSEVRGVAGPARLPVRRATPSWSASRDPGRDARRRSGRPGTRRCARTARSSSRRSPTRRCRRCRRTSRSSRPRRSARRCCRGDPHAGRIIRQSFKQKMQEFLPGPMSDRTQSASGGPRSRSSRSRPTRSRPTRPRPTGRSRWDSTTIVVVHARPASERGSATPTPTSRPRRLIESKLRRDRARPRRDVAPQAAWAAMVERRSATSAGPGSPRWRSPRSTWRCGT